MGILYRRIPVVVVVVLVSGSADGVLAGVYDVYRTMNDMSVGFSKWLIGI